MSEIDFDFINFFYELYVDKSGYVATKLKVRKMGVPTGKLHAIIMQPTKGKNVHVDHEDGNKLNNTRENLRICSHSENMKNRKPNDHYRDKRPASKYKGVTWHKHKQAWEACIGVDGKKVFIGTFANDISAAKAYNEYARTLHMDFARLNEIDNEHQINLEDYRISNKRLSSYRGVTFDKSGNKWVSQIYDGISKKMIQNRHDTEIEAALAYNEMVLKLRGAKAKLNVI